MIGSTTKLRDVISEGTSIFLKNIWKIILLIIIFSTSLSVATLLLFPELMSIPDTMSWLAILQTALIPGIIAGIIFMVFTISIILIADETYRGKRVELMSVLKEAISLWPAVVFVSVITAAFLLGLTLLLIIPGIIFGVYWHFVAYSVILKGKRGMDALVYSKKMVEGRWWQLVGYIIVITLISAIINLVGMPFELFLPESYGFLAGDFFNTLSISYIMCLVTVLFEKWS